MNSTQNTDIALLNEEIIEKSRSIDQLIQELSRVIIGQDSMIRSLMIGLLGNGHILLEGVPGLAKTLAINTLSKVVFGSFSRIQFTPDLLPADVIGTTIYNIKENKFSVKKGPVFANFLLADEINRAPAKVQSALLEAMQERQVTIGEKSFELQEPFLVMATQNPLEQEGTYPLPEAQMDRFMLKSVITYPQLEDERLIIRSELCERFEKTGHVTSLEEIVKVRDIIKMIYMDEKIEQYILDIVFATRFPENYSLREIKPFISFGASPRGSINLAIAAKVYAFLQKRSFVIPEDIRAVVHEVLRHRIGITYEGEAEDITADELINRVVTTVQVP